MYVLGRCLETLRICKDNDQKFAHCVPTRLAFCLKGALNVERALKKVVTHCFLPASPLECLDNRSALAESLESVIRFVVQSVLGDARQYELRTRSRSPVKEEAQIHAKLSVCTHFYHDYRDGDSNCDNWRSSERNDYNRDDYQSHFDDKPDL
ncbi:hypothetical protein Tco_1142150 [Tanacetum coccineum]